MMNHDMQRTATRIQRGVISVSGLMRCFSCIILLLLASTAGFAQNANQSVSELQAAISQTSDFRQRHPLYLHLLDKLPSNNDQRSTWCRRFLLDAQKNQNEVALVDASKQIINTGDTVLMNDAIRVLEPIAESPDMWRIGNMVLVLKCQRFESRCIRANAAQRDRMLSHTLQQINALNFRQIPPRNQYLLYFQAQFLYTLLPNNPPPERYTSEMVALAEKMGDPLMNTPMGMAMSLYAETCLLNGRYQSGTEMDKQQLKRISQLEEDYRKQGRAERNYDRSRYIIYNRMLLCHFALTHKINQEYYQKAYSLWQKDKSLQSMPVSRQIMLPVFIDINEGRFNDAYTKHKQLTDKIRQNGEELTDFEYDMCSWMMEKNGNFKRSLELIDEHNLMLKRKIEQQSSQYLQELGLDDELTKFLQKERQLDAEHSRLVSKQLQDELEILEEQNRMRQDSIRTLETIQKLENEEAMNKQAYEDAEKELASSKWWHNRIGKRLTAASIGVLFIILLVGALYDRRIQKVNKSLKAKHQQLRASKEQATELLRMKVNFLQNMSSVIQRPMNAISFCCQKICDEAEKADADNEIHELKELVKENSKQLSHLVRELTEINQLETGSQQTQWEDIVVSDFIVKLAQQHTAVKGRTIETHSELPGGFCFTTDPNLLRRMLELLLNNARKFAPDGSITIHSQILDNQLAISVEDHGPGIPSEQTESVFKRFYKLDEFTTGAGLGLSLCRLISNTLHGTININTTYTEGTRITFLHPLQCTPSKRYASIPKKLLLLICMMLPAASPVAENLDAVQKRLEQQLQKEESLEKRIYLLQNLCDLALNKTPQERIHYATMLMDAELEANDYDGILRAAGEMANTEDIPTIQKAIECVKPLAESEEKKGILTFLICKSDIQKLKSLSPKEQEAIVTRLIDKITPETMKDIYNRYYIAFVICNLSNEKEYNIIIDQFMQELINLCGQMNLKMSYLENQALLKGVELCMQTREYGRCKQYYQKVLDNILNLEKYYMTNNRPYRRFEANKLWLYLQMVQCRSAMTDSEMQEIIRGLNDVTAKKPELLDYGNTRELCQMITYQQEENWKSLKQLFDKSIARSNELLTLPEEELYGAEYSDYFLDLMASTYRHLGDTTRLLTALRLSIDHQRRSMRSMTTNSFRHLATYANILNAKQRIDLLKQKNNAQALQQKLNDARTVSKLREMELQHANEEIKQRQLKKRNKQLQELRNQLMQENKSLIERNQQAEGAALMTTVAILLLALFLLIFYTLRLRTQRQAIIRTDRRMQYAISRTNISNQERTEFLQNINHEIRTPLNAIIGFCDHLINEMVSDNKTILKNYGKTIKLQSEYVTTMISNVIDLSVLQSNQTKMKHEECDLQENLKISIANANSYLDKNILIQLDNTLPVNFSIFSDRIRLQQLITNTLTSAFQHCINNSMNIKTTQNEHGDCMRLEFTYDENIITEDAPSMGILADEADLPLEISRLIAKRLGGRLSSKSPKQGTRNLIIELPTA